MMSAQRSVSALSLPALETPPLTHERRVASCDDLLSTSRRRGDLEEEEALKAALALSEWELQRSKHCATDEHGRCVCLRAPPCERHSGMPPHAMEPAICML